MYVGSGKDGGNKQATRSFQNRVPKVPKSCSRFDGKGGRPAKNDRPSSARQIGSLGFAASACTMYVIRGGWLGSGAVAAELCLHLLLGRPALRVWSVLRMARHLVTYFFASCSCVGPTLAKLLQLFDEGLRKKRFAILMCECEVQDGRARSGDLTPFRGAGMRHLPCSIPPACPVSWECLYARQVSHFIVRHWMRRVCKEGGVESLFAWSNEADAVSTDSRPSTEYDMVTLTARCRRSTSLIMGNSSAAKRSINRCPRQYIFGTTHTRSQSKHGILPRTRNTASSHPKGQDYP